MRVQFDVPVRSATPEKPVENKKALIAIFGAPGCGKSTFVEALTGQKAVPIRHEPSSSESIHIS